MAGDTHYEVLGIGPGADHASIRRAYVGLARQFHPDFHHEATPAIQAHAEAKMREINAAWAVLGKTSARSRYDRELRESGRMTESGPVLRNQAPSAPPERTSGTAPPRWLTMAPVLSLALAVACFSVGMVTGLAVLLAGAVGFALVGGALFAIVPLVALKRSKTGSRSPNGPTVSA